MAGLADLLPFLAQQQPPTMMGAGGDSPLAALLQSIGQATPAKIPPFIDLRADRPAPAPAPNILDFLKGLIPGTPMTDAEMAAVPGAVPPAVPPGQTPVGSGMFERQGPPILPAVAAALPPVPASPPSPIPAAGARPDMPMPVMLPPAAAQQPDQKPPQYTFGLPAATPASGTQHMTISPDGTISAGGAPQAAQTAAADPMIQYANAIKGIESSGGNYQAVGPTHPKYGRALGAYQVMESNIGPWTKEILGKEMTPDEFLKNPAAQDAVFRGKFGQYVQQYGNPQDAASAWFTGGPLATGANKQDALGTTGNKYVDQFTKNLNAPAQNAFGFPTPNARVAPQLPIPPALQALQAVNPAAFDALMKLQPTAMRPLSLGERLTGVLGGAAAGAKGANNIGDLLLGMGAGASKGAESNILLERGDQARYNAAKDSLARLAAETGVRKEEAVTLGKNYQTEAANANTKLLNQVATEQAKLDTEAKNAMAEIGDRFNLQKFQYFQPQVHATDSGVTVISRKPDGTMDVNTTKLNDFKTEADKIEQTVKANLGDKNAPAVKLMQYQALRNRYGEEGVRGQILRDMVEGNHVPSVLDQETYKKLEAEAKKGLDPAAQGRPEYTKAMHDKMYSLLWQKFMTGKPEERQQMDQLWLPYMLRKGNVGAAMLAQPGV